MSLHVETQDWLLWGVIVIVIGLTIVVLAGCKNTTNDVEFCYDHPRYGKVCIRLNGQRYVRADLKPEEKKEVLEWLDEEKKGQPRPPGTSGPNAPEE